MIAAASQQAQRDHPKAKKKASSFRKAHRQPSASSAARMEEETASLTPGSGGQRTKTLTVRAAEPAEDAPETVELVSRASRDMEGALQERLPAKSPRGALTASGRWGVARKAMNPAAAGAKPPKPLPSNDTVALAGLSAGGTEPEPEPEPDSDDEDGAGVLGMAHAEEKAAHIRFFLHPDHTQRRLWDLWLLVLIVYVAIAIPLRIGFVRASLHALPTRRG